MVSYKRVNKALARKMFNSGCEILLLPCKVRDDVVNGGNPWIKPITISIFNSEFEENKFDRSVIRYEHYNCNAEVGYYSHYFVSEQDFENYNMCKIMCD